MGSLFSNLKNIVNKTSFSLSLSLTHKQETNFVFASVSPPDSSFIGSVAVPPNSVSVHVSLLCQS